MEDILASIRRILNEDEAAASAAEHAEPEAVHAAAPAAHSPAAAEEEDVLLLDESMMVQPHAASAPPPPEPLAMEAAAVEPPDPVTIPMTQSDTPAPPPVSGEPVRHSDLLAPESEAATVSSVGSLLRTLTAERQTQVHRGGPTIEDLVREEIRPLLKGWLDNHLPPLVERLVRAEIERVMGRVSL